MKNEIYLKISDSVENSKNPAIRLLQNLVRIPSVNHPPYGDEKHVQEFYNDWLCDNGIESKLVYTDEISGFDIHPARLNERDMTGRPNVIAKIKGSGAGRSLLILAHADTESIGDVSKWTDDPFSGIERDGRIYGRGSGDDKSGMTIAAILPLILREAKINLLGDLVIASVSDEEQGGANGTAALLAKNIKTDAAIYLDGTNNQAIWHAGLGCGIVTITISSIASESLQQSVKNIQKIILEQKEKIKQAIIMHPTFGKEFFDDIMMHHFFNISIIPLDEHNISLSFVLDTLPGDDEALIKKQFEEKLNVQSCHDITVKISWMSRFLKPALIDKNHPLVTELSQSFELATGRNAIVAPGCQSDQGIISHFGNIPCVLFGCGRRGKEGAPHLPDEYIVIDEFMENLLTTALFAAKWCGI